MMLKSVFKSITFLLAISLSSLVFLVQTASAQTVDVKEFFDESFGDLSEEISIAKEDGKKALLIMFELDECPFCHWMKQRVLNQKLVQDYFREHFRIINIDVEGDLEIVDFAGNDTSQKDFSLKQYRVRATPVFQFVGLDGLPVKRARLTGSVKNYDEFLLFGKFVVDEHYKKMAFSKYKRLQKNQDK
jgi:thioredoxin-related protein